MSGVCCSIQLRTGVITIGILTGILPLVGIIIINNVFPIMRDIHPWALITTPMFLEILASILLIIGAKTNRWNLMMPWMLTSSILLYIMLHFQIVMWLALIHADNPVLSIGFIFVVSLLMSFFVYFMLVIYRYIKDVRKAVLMNV